MDDQARMRVVSELFDAIERGKRIGALGVDRHDEPGFAIVAEVIEVTGQDHRAALLETQQQYLMTRCVSRRLQDPPNCRFTRG